jgi:PKD repeat protein
MIRNKAFLYLFVSLVLGIVNQIYAEIPQTHFDDERNGVELFFESRVDFFPLSYKPSSVVVAPDGSRLYALNPTASRVDVYDLSTKQQVFSISVPEATALSVDQATSFIYVAAGSRLAVFDPASFEEIQSTTLDSSISALAIDSRNRRIYLASNERRAIWMLDENSLRVLSSYTKLTLAPTFIGLNSQNSHLYINDLHSITVLDSRTLTYIDDLRLEGLPGAFFIGSDSIFIELSNEESIAVYDTVQNELVDWFSTKGFRKGRWFVTQRGELRLVGSRNEILDAVTVRENARNQITQGDIPSSLAAGSEFTLSQSNGAKDFPSADFDGSGNFVATWTDLAGNDGSGEGVYGREFSGAGAGQGSEFIINEKRSQNQGNSSLASTSGGDYVVVWRDDNGFDGDEFGVFFRRFANGGNPKDSSDQKAANTTEGNQREPSVDVEPGGDFAIVWTGPPGGGGKGVFLRRFSASGSPKGSEQLVDSASNEYAPDVATNGSRTAVVWRNGSDDLVRVRVYNSSGSPVTGVFKVSASSNNQFAPSVAMDSSGKFAVAWQENAAGGIQVRLFDADGNPRGSARKASVVGDKDYSPAISMAPDGRFAIAWRDDNLVAWARSFKSDGTPASDEFKPSQSGGNQLAANCAVDKDANFVVTWKFRPGNGGGSIRGRRFGSDGGGGGGGGSAVTVDCSAKPKKGAPPLKVDFTADATGGNGSFSFKWDFGDGSTSTTQNPSHTYNNSGDFDAIVTVTSGSDTATCSKNISVGGGGGGGGGNGKINVASLSKTSGKKGTTNMKLSILGAGFKKGATVSFHDSGIVVTKVRFRSKTKLSIRINIKNSANTGAHDVTVTNPGGNSDTGPNLFTVN